MNMVYFLDSGLDEKILLGVKKKIYGQIEAFIEEGYNGYLFYKDSFKVYLVDFGKNEKKEYFYLDEQDLYSWIYDMIIKLEPKVIYNRKVGIFFNGYFLMKFWEKLKTKLPKTKFIVEIPTFPYDNEIDDKTLLSIDKYYRKELKQIFDFSINMNKYDDIFSIKSISINNGVSLKQIPLKKNKVQDKKVINLISVSSMARWHGYHRILEGMKNYYAFSNNEYTVNCIFVGEGECLKKLMNLTQEYNLENYVQFKGSLDGRELDAVFDISDIALGSFGFYKIDLKQASTLKTKEYCAKGIPFVVGYDEVSFDDNYKYMLKVENANKPIDIYKIIEFYKRVQQNKDFSYEMRKYAEENFEWHSLYKEVFKEIDKENI